MGPLKLTVLACLGVLFALTLARQLFLDPLPRPAANVVWLVVQVLPLVLVLPGVLRERALGYLLSALVGMLFFVYGIQGSMGTEDAPVARIAQATAAVSVLLVACATFALKRLRGRAREDAES